MICKLCCKRCGSKDFVYSNRDVVAGVIYEETAHCHHCGYFVYHMFRDDFQYAKAPNIFVRLWYKFFK